MQESRTEPAPRLLARRFRNFAPAVVWQFRYRHLRLFLTEVLRLVVESGRYRVRGEYTPNAGETPPGPDPEKSKANRVETGNGTANCGSLRAIDIVTLICLTGYKDSKTMQGFRR